jgi:hypothetical protein
MHNCMMKVSVICYEKILYSTCIMNEKGFAFSFSFHVILNNVRMRINAEKMNKGKHGVYGDNTEII